MRQGTEFLVNLNFLADNYERLQSYAPHNEVIFMVKANAYGHGIIEITEFANQSLKIKKFGVASLGEALFIRENAPQLDCDLWVFSDTEFFNPSMNHYYASKKIVPVISSLDQLDYFYRCGSFQNIHLVLKFDTGMNRLGIDYQDIEKVIKKLEQFKVKHIHHVMTHFVSSYLKSKEGDKTQLQLRRFQKIKTQLRDANIEIAETSCANSGAIEQRVGLDETHIRPGLMLYGPRSVGTFKKEEAQWDGKCISSLKSKIIKVSAIQKGTPVGYGAHVCQSNGTLVYLPLGYGDGFLTYYSGLKLKHKGLVGEVFGRVNMDLIAVIFPNVPVEHFTVGEEFILWSHSQDSIVDWSTQAGSIPYQVLTAITARVPKRYIYE